MTKYFQGISVYKNIFNTVISEPLSNVLQIKSIFFYNLQPKLQGSLLLKLTAQAIDKIVMYCKPISILLVRLYVTRFYVLSYW